MSVFHTHPLITEKTAVPPRPGRVVERARLRDRLRASTDARLTAVVAPAGWGKTTLLAAWARDDPGEARPVAWLSLESGDNEPVRFWTYVLAALSTVMPELARQASNAMAGQGLDPVAAALPALLNALSGVEERYVLVLDDYHLITEPRVHETVGLLVGHLPPALHLVLAARSDPPLPLARMRARGELAEIRRNDLRCTADEGAALIAGSGAQASSMVDELVARVEGWPAGLHLSALVVRETADPAAVRGDQRPILEYFVEEVMPDLEDAARDLLVRCSVLDRLTGPLCDAVLGTTGSAAVLDRLERADLFVTATDPSRRWYRCHQLFRDVLRRELDTMAPGAAGELLGRAADWYLTRDHVPEAVAARIEAGDAAGAAALLDGRWFFDRGAAAALLHAGEQLTGACAGRPQVCVWMAHAAAVSGRPRTRARWWLETAEPHIAADSTPPPEGWRSLRAFADVIWSAYVVPDDAEASLRFAGRAVDLEDDPHRWGWVEARLMLAVARRGVGELGPAVALLDEAWGVPGRRSMPILPALQAAGELMLGLVSLGERDRARQVGSEVAATVAAIEQAWGPGAAAATARVRLAEARMTLATQGPEAALPELRRAVELARIWGRPNIMILALTSLAAALWATGEHEAARAALERAHASAESNPPRPYALDGLAELEARLGRGGAREARRRGLLVEELTDRELAVLRALRGPLSAREIGVELHLSINTVKGYTKSLYRKLDVETRAAAVARAHELGLV